MVFPRFIEKTNYQHFTKKNSPLSRATAIYKLKAKGLSNFFYG